MPARRAVLALVALLWSLGACAADTSHLDPDQEARLAADTVVLRGDNFIFRHSREVGRATARWDGVRASIVVTRHTLLIHQRGYVLLLIQPTSRRRCEVHRDRERVRINAGTGGSAEVWSFQPPATPEAWTDAIRDVIRGSGSVANPRAP